MLRILAQRIIPIGQNVYANCLHILCRPLKGCFIFAYPAIVCLYIMEQISPHNALTTPVLNTGKSIYCVIVFAHNKCKNQWMNDVIVLQFIHVRVQCSFTPKWNKSIGETRDYENVHKMLLWTENNLLLKKKAVRNWPNAPNHFDDRP